PRSQRRHGARRLRHARGRRGAGPALGRLRPPGPGRRDRRARRGVVDRAAHRARRGAQGTARTPRRRPLRARRAGGARLRPGRCRRGLRPARRLLHRRPPDERGRCAPRRLRPSPRLGRVPRGRGRRVPRSCRGRDGLRAVTGTVDRRLVLLGATGSIGAQALDVLTRYPQLARLHGLAVGGSRPELVAAQVLAHRPEHLVVSDPERAEAVEAAVHAACRDAAQAPPRLETGQDAVIALAGALGEGDVVLNAITGSVGLLPTLAALASGARLALANKESLVVGGHLVTDAAAPGQILPVDSEHTAIAQALAGVRHEHIEHLVVTASGGPFRGRSREQLAAVTPEQALAHPTWSMGRVITTNSATLV